MGDIIQHKKKLSNWAKLLIIIGILCLLMLHPITRSVVMFILPLGSGIDDLIFFILLFAFLLVFSLKLINFHELLVKIGKWLGK